jgi:3-keto-5-aminohexanoate cleavage enzyme
MSNTERMDIHDQDEWLRRSIKRELPPAIVTVAITGGIQGKEINPNHPETPKEQAEQTYECYKLGASMVHIHARCEDDPSESSTDPERYREINALIREKCPDIIINNTTSNKALNTNDENAAPLEDQLKSLDANPEVCSLNMGPLMGRLKLRPRPPYRPESVTMEVVTAVNLISIETIAKTTMERGIKPEIEIWHHGQIPVLRGIINQGLVKPPYWLQFVLGNNNGADPTPKNLIHEIDLAPKDSIVSVAGLMPFQTQMATMALLLGLNVRTGMEDNPYYDKGELCTGNAQLVERVIRLAKELGREIATPKQARQMMGISEKPSKY